MLSALITLGQEMDRIYSNKKTLPEPRRVNCVEKILDSLVTCSQPQDVSSTATKRS